MDMGKHNSDGTLCCVKVCFQIYTLFCAAVTVTTGEMKDTMMGAVTVTFERNTVDMAVMGWVGLGQAPVAKVMAVVTVEVSHAVSAFSSVSATQVIKHFYAYAYCSAVYFQKRMK